MHSLKCTSKTMRQRVINEMKMRTHEINRIFNTFHCRVGNDFIHGAFFPPKSENWCKTSSWKFWHKHDYKREIEINWQRDRVVRYYINEETNEYKFLVVIPRSDGSGNGYMRSKNYCQKFNYCDIKMLITILEAWVMKLPDENPPYNL